MANLEELVVALTAETSGLRSELSKAIKTTEQATSKMDDAIKSFSENSTQNLSFFQQATATMAGFLGGQVVTKAFEVFKDGLVFIKGELIAGAEAAIAQENASIKLANSLALTGNYSAAAVDDLKAFADAQENLTGIGDDVVASNLAIMSSLTRLDSEGLKAAQKAAIDLSASLDMDLSSATMLVSKGINGNVEAFKRYGIEIQEGGSKSANLANILKGLATQTGAAEGATKTFGGSVKNMSNAYGNLVEAFASTIVQNPVIIAGFQEITNILRELTGGVEANAGVWRENLAIAILATLEAIEQLLHLTDAFIRVMLAGCQTIVLGLNAVAGSISWVADALGLIEDNDPFKNMGETYGALEKNITQGGALTEVVKGLDRVGNAGMEALYKVRDAGAATVPTVKGVTAAVAELTAAEQIHNDAVKAFASGFADNGAKLEARYEYEQELLAADLEAKLVTEAEFASRKLEQLAAQQATEQALIEEARAKDLIGEEQYRNALTALSQKHYLDQRKAEQSLTAAQEKEQKQRLQSTADVFGNLAVLTESSNKELATIGKAAAISKATIDGYLAIQNALANVPYPLNIAAAASIGVMTAANVAKISGVGFNKGVDSVPGIGNRDTVPAMLTPGERVVPQKTNQDLTEFLKNGGSGGGAPVTINISFSGVFSGDRAEFGSMVVDAVNEALSRGSSNGFVKGAVSA